MKKAFALAGVLFHLIGFSQPKEIDDCPLSFASQVEEDRISAMIPFANEHNAKGMNQPMQLSAFTYNFYRGSLHTHTAYSDGDLDGVCPTFGSAATCCYGIGDGAINFDYMGISDHNHNEGPVMTMAKFNSGLSESSAYNSSAAGPNFATTYGLEWGTISTGGHVLIHDIYKLMGWNTSLYNVFVAKGDYNRLFFVTDSLGGFCILAHPTSTDYAGIFNTAAYNSMWDNVIVGVSLENGPYNSTNTSYSNPPTGTPDEIRYKDLLKKGYHVGPTIDMDNHNSNTMGKSSQGRTVVLENTLSKSAVINAFKSMRFYATEDYNVQVLFDINSSLIMGSIGSSNTSPVLNISVSDPDAGDNVTSIEIWYGVPGSGAAATLLTSNSNSAALTFTHTTANLSTYYYYAKITQSDGHRMWTAPIWYTTNTALPVKLSDFSVRTGNNSDAIIQWRAETEKDCKKYSLLRSKNSGSYEKIYSCTCQNNVYGSRYSYTDTKLEQGIYYYKLVEEATDGSITDNGIVYLELNNGNLTPHVYADSENNTIVISCRDAELSKTQVTVLDINGRKIYNATPASGYIRINDLAKGIYLIQLETGNRILNYKISL